MRSIRDYGVYADGYSDETILIQKAIDECAVLNEELLFDKGVYVVTSLNLPDNSVIIINEGAVIKGNPCYESWADFSHRPIICSENSRNITIKGEGEINCNGAYYRDEVGKALSGARPHGTVAFRNCNNITLSGVTVCDSVSWTIHLDNCEYALIDGVTVRNPEYNKSNCSDGIDVNGCRHIEIKNCDIETGDDAICLKNINLADPDKNREDMHDVFIHDCILATTCNGFKIGTETVGDVYDVRVENIEVKRHSQCADCGYPEGMGIPLSAINIQSNDGGSIHNISVENLYAAICGTPIFMVLQKRMENTANIRVGSLYDITISDVKVDKSVRPSLINCCDGSYIDNVTIKNFEAHNFEEYTGELKAIKASGRCYPDPYNYGHFPAYGLFAYNVKNLNIDENVVFIDECSSGRESVIIKNKD